MPNKIFIIKQPFFGVGVKIKDKNFIFCFCHHLPSRSIKFLGIENYLCARCFGMLCGSIIGIIICIIYPIPFPISFIILIPLIVDGGVQALTKYESTNRRRFITGLLFGVGLFSSIYWLAMLTRVLLFGGS